MAWNGSLSEQEVCVGWWAGEGVDGDSLHSIDQQIQIMGSIYLLWEDGVTTIKRERPRMNLVVLVRIQSVLCIHGGKNGWIDERIDTDVNA